MTRTVATADVYRATTLHEAARMLLELGTGGEALGGGTWVMRAPARGESLRESYVSLGRIPELRELTIGDDVVLGAGLTHARLAGITGSPALTCIREAARQSAFPQVRAVATLGGNIRALGFAEADLVPALLAAGTEVELYTTGGTSRMSLERYLPVRDQRPPGEVISRVHVPAPRNRVSAFERLTVRSSGEYPILNVALSADVDNGVVRAARLAVGSMEPVARLCHAAEAALIGHHVGDAAAIETAATEAAMECVARDGLDAPAWYRREVLPSLIRRVALRLSHDSI
ncbi:carbon-monoxide dehydrogenase medium subunit [Haloechinothrix alba]|uniref:Carbon-monoxide dehydrogenase medium subunit n=1 Tax=Haloechinothrix alba TaxID=664784 RepID=A0A238Y598_9PSEU|nr:FAD binding domain-containing protein [Haloechinothrix alba]SNR65843.1 carbon-monoxide dehydrogenase medium subunit [Haloechinothrix alba]